MVGSQLLLVFAPVVAAIAGAIVSVMVRPGPGLVSAIQHLTAGVVFAAAAGEILPELKHSGAVGPVIIGGGLGVIAILAIMQMERRVKGPVGLMATIRIDLLVDGVILGLAFIAGTKAGLLLTVALTLEVLFLGVTVANELGEGGMSRRRIVLTSAGLILLMPLGVLLATPAAAFPPATLTGCFAFSLVALLYLVTEELLVEAHEMPDTPLITAMFFVGFLGLLLLDELIS